MHSFTSRWITALTLMLSLTSGTWADPTVTSTQSDRKRVLVLSKVSDNPEKHYRYLKPMADYLAARLHNSGILEGTVLLAKDNRQMIDYLREGRVDLVTETPVSAALFVQEASAVPIARK